MVEAGRLGNGVEPARIPTLLPGFVTARWRNVPAVMGGVGELDRLDRHLAPSSTHPTEPGRARNPSAPGGTGRTGLGTVLSDRSVIQFETVSSVPHLVNGPSPNKVRCPGS